MPSRQRSALTATKLRSAITNGSFVLADTDHRTSWMRRLKDLRAAFFADAGGEDILSEGQRALIGRAAMLELQSEMLETKFANNEGVASAKDLDLYGRNRGNLRRCIETLGLHTGRKPRDVTQASETLELWNEAIASLDAEAAP
jgi:hypothetical protein